MFKKIFNNLINNNESKLSSIREIVKQINALEEKYKSKSDQELQKIFNDWKSKLRGEDLIDKHKEQSKFLDEILPDAYAIVREAASRTMGQRHRDVQLMSGIVLHQGKVSEQKTGEGKTLTATLPLSLNALTGYGVHLVTPNDYLSKHGAGWYGPVYKFLGLTVGVIIDRESFVFDTDYIVPNVEDEYTKHLRPSSRAEAYTADITYGTASAFGFDYLRDNMANQVERISQLNPNKKYDVHNFAIVDEVDSVLIDVARTPLIISSSREQKADSYYKFAKLAEGLVKETDYTVDEKDKILNLTELGINKIERKLNVENLYEKDFEVIHQIENALKAKELYLKDRDYVIQDGKIYIVDQNTGRILVGNRWSRGLHQSIEAKEGLEVQDENKTVASISYQNFFRLYRKLAGMTGTAETEAEEFHKIYSLDVVVIPTNKPVARIDFSDVVYKTETGKYKAIAADIKERHSKGQPILVGTVSVEKSELLSKYLKRLGIKHEILNAKQHEREAQVIRQAGKKGSVTVATNMAGRGVDIILGGDPFDKESFDEIILLGGLYVIGTERHDSRRIDNQLRGRSGRQGEVGESRFYLSLQDDLMRIFGGDRVEAIMNRMGVGDDVPIEAKLISRVIENAQKRVEGINFDSRRSLVEFDDVMNVQRETMYKMRRKFLLTKFEDAEEFYKWLKGRLEGNIEYDFDELMESRIKKYGDQLWFEVVKRVSLETIDMLWMDHIDNMDDLRKDVGLRGYGQVDPIVEYKREGKELFDTLIKEIMVSSGERLSIVNVEVTQRTPLQKVEATETSAGSYESGFKDEKADLKSQAKVTAVADEYKGVGRNDLCPCGSGKKFKQCHGKRS